jgi:hypothetical protein
LEEAVATGKGLTATEVVVVFWHPLLFMTVSVYIPAIADVALTETVGLCNSELKPLGPDQL